MDMDKKVFERCSQMLSDNHYAVIDQFLTSEEVSEILVGLEKKYSHDQFKTAGVGQNNEHQENAKVRKDMIYWIEPEKNFEIERRFVPYLNSFMAYLNQSCFLSLMDYEMHYSVYPNGAFYGRHLDQFKKDNNRILTFICYLNFGWKSDDGGALRIYLNKDNQSEQYVDILPEAGRLVCFKSNLLEHEVIATNRQRLSLSGWMLRRKVDNMDMRHFY